MKNLTVHLNPNSSTSLDLSYSCLRYFRLNYYFLKISFKVLTPIPLECDFFLHEVMKDLLCYLSLNYIAALFHAIQEKQQTLLKEKNE
jgi:hypothetical protein